MKFKLPLLITMITGIIMVIKEFIPHNPFDSMDDILQDWYMIVASFAIILGVESLIHVHSMKISFKRKDWQYSVVLIVTLFLMAFCGLFGGIEDKEFYNLKNEQELETVLAMEIMLPEGSMAIGSLVPEGTADKGRYLYDNQGKLKYDIVKSKNVSARHPERSYAIPAQYQETVNQSLKKILRDKQVFLHRGGLAYAWIFYLYGGFQFSYRFIYTALGSTMFSILAFFVASAAYRAFKARTLEATLLLLSAFIVMLGRVTFGEMIADITSIDIPQITEWLIDYPNTAGQKAIMIGIALGIISTSLRVILGIEKSYLGRD